MTIQTLVPDDLWEAIEPLLPPPPRRFGGRPRIEDRAALAGIIYQLHTGIPWRLLPVRELGCGSPVTCWRRLRDWQRGGVWPQLHHRLLDRLGHASQLDWSRASLDSISVRAKRGGPDRSQSGRPRQAWVQYHLLTDRRGLPLAVGLSAANTHDSMLLVAMVDAVPVIKGPRGRPGRPRKRPAKLHLDKGYDYRAAGGRCVAVGSPTDRPAWRGAKRQARPPPVRRGAVLGVAGGLPTPAGPLDR
jgi:transposase